MQKKDFVFVGLQPWDIEIGSNCKNIATEVARRHRVLYVNRPLDRSSQWRNRRHQHIRKRREVLTGQSNDLYRVQSNLWVLNPRIVVESINWIGWSPLYRRLNKRNARQLTAQIFSATQRLGFNHLVVFNDNDFLNYFYLPELLSPDLYVYYIRDFLTSQPYFSRHRQLEEQLMSKADIVLANSEYLRDYGAQYNPRSFFVGQGCDFNISVTDLAEPEDIKVIPQPRIGYTGALLANRLDIALIGYCAEALPQYSFVLVGPEDANFASSKLHRMANVHFLGAKPVTEVSRYIRQFDVCINPQQVNPLTIGNYPRKIDEYLSMGKPVVATATQAMDYFAEHVYLAKDAASFAALLVQAHTEDEAKVREQRRAFALSHTWEHCAKKIYQALDTVQCQIDSIDDEKSTTETQ